MRRSLQNIYRLGVKELFSLGRDAVLMFLIVYAFTYGIVGPAKGVTMDIKDASIAIVDEDHSLISARIREGFLPPFFLKAVEISAGEIDDAMDAGKYTFVVDIPPDFQRDVERGRQPAVKVNVDATAMAQAALVDQLHQVLVTSDDYELHPLRRETLRECADHVVGFDPGDPSPYRHRWPDTRC